MRRVALVLLLAAVAAGDELSKAERETRQAVSAVHPSVVTVYTTRKDDFNLTGVAIGGRGVILTLRGPLVDKRSGLVPKQVTVRVPGRGKSVQAEVMDEDADTNTIVLQLPKISVRKLQARRAVDVRLGQWVMLVGNTFGSGQEGQPTVSLGVVSGLVRSGEAVTEIHASTLVNPGSFGAPIVDTGGNLIGIAAYKVTRAGGQTVVIPYDRIRERYRELDRKGARLLSTAPRPRRPSRRVTDALGLVAQDAAERARVALVGVRAGRIKEDDAPAPKPDPKAKKPKRRGPRKPRPVAGKLPAYDRCSGVVVGADGWILCPLRVTGWPGPARPLLVDLSDGRSLPAKVLGTDERLRIALLSVRAKGLEVLPPAPRDVRTGSFVLALGYPHEEPERATPQVTFGIVSRMRALGGLHVAMQAVQTDAGVSGGNRGGPLIDLEGRFVGLLLDVNDTSTQGYMTRMAGAYVGNAGLGFALPPNVLDQIVPRLAKGVRFRLGFLGVSTRTGKLGLDVLNVVEKNSKGAPTTATRAGLEKGDVLVRIGKTPMKEHNDLRAALAYVTVGDKIEIEYLRGDKRKTVTVELGER
ncbi:MAG: trypsin-like peptidase domain-containing protein [Planctomycetota bacterium]|jgi:S1-C subfamily serine protease